MAEVFRCVDRWGRGIVLTDERWLSHVVAHHPEFLGYERIVEATLMDPDFVNRDRQRVLREVFYRASSVLDPGAGLLVRVVVEFGVMGRVVTAHLIPKPHQKERRRWP